jgi:hypothetical protein
VPPAPPALDEPTTARDTAAVPRELPAEPGPLEPGRYETSVFEVPLSFELPASWSLLAPERGRSFVFELPQGDLREESVFVAFMMPVRVASSDPDAIDEFVLPPDDWAAWYQSHPRIDAEGPERATVGGVSAVRIDNAVRNPYDHPACPVPCVFVYTTGDFNAFAVESQKSRDYVLDVDGETVIVSILAPKDRFDELVGEGESIVQSIRFGEDAQPESDTAATALTVPAAPGPLEPGRYRTSTFEVPLSFDVPAGALLLSPDRRRSLVLELPQGGGPGDSVLVAVMLPVRAATPEPQPTFEAAPDDWADWFESHPRLRAGERQPADVGGVRAVVIDAAVTDPYEDPGCPAPCVYLFTTGDSTAFAGGGQTARSYIVEVGGQTLLIGILAPSERFDELVGQGEAVVRSIRFE